MPEYYVRAIFPANIHKVVEARTPNAAKLKAMDDSKSGEWWFEDRHPSMNDPQTNVRILEVQELSETADGCKI